MSIGIPTDNRAEQENKSSGLYIVPFEGIHFIPFIQNQLVHQHRSYKMTASSLLSTFELSWGIGK